MRQAFSIAASWAVSCVFSVLVAGAAMADQRDFTLVNSTGDAIDQVFVESVKSDEWGDDVMGRDSLEDGESVDISFEGYGSQCVFDMKAVYADGEAVVWYDINLCKISRLTLFWDQAAQKTWAVSE